MKVAVPLTVLTVSLVCSRIGLISFWSRLVRRQAARRAQPAPPDHQPFQRHRDDEEVAHDLHAGGSARIGQEPDQRQQESQHHSTPTSAPIPITIMRVAQARRTSLGRVFSRSGKHGCEGDRAAWFVLT
jgi:hypothetical protein